MLLVIRNTKERDRSWRGIKGRASHLLLKSKKNGDLEGRETVRTKALLSDSLQMRLGKEEQARKTLIKDDHFGIALNGLPINRE